MNPTKKSPYEMLFGQKPKHKIDALRIPLTHQLNYTGSTLINISIASNESQNRNDIEMMSSTKSNQISSFVYEASVDAMNAFGELEVSRKSPLLIETRGQYGRMSLVDDSISRVVDRKYLVQFCYSINL
jgi:hypothetical protein